MAVRVGFEPTEPVKVQRFSRPPDSTTLAPHRSLILSDFPFASLTPSRDAHSTLDLSHNPDRYPPNMILPVYFELSSGPLQSSRHGFYRSATQRCPAPRTSGGHDHPCGVAARPRYSDGENQRPESEPWQFVDYRRWVRSRYGGPPAPCIARLPRFRIRSDGR